MRKIEASGRSGIAAVLLSRIFAALLLFAFLLPAVSQSEAVGTESDPFAHSFQVVVNAEAGSNHAQDGCGLECPQHAFFRHAEVQNPSTAVRRIARALIYALSDETARSSDVDPPSKPPRA